MDEEAVIIAISGITIALLLLSTGFMLFVYFFFNAKRKNLEEKKKQELFFMGQLGAVRSEIRDQTLQYVKRELHDNIGQLLTLQMIHLRNIMKQSEDREVSELNDIVLKTIRETKELTSSIKSTPIGTNDLLTMISEEIDRINKVSSLKATLDVVGEPLKFSEEESLVIFRLIQEFLNNSMKHSQGEKFEVHMDYHYDELTMTLKDNGIGFNTKDKHQGNGLKYMYERVGMLNGNMNITSGAHGTSVQINLKTKEV